MNRNRPTPTREPSGDDPLPSHQARRKHFRASLVFLLLSFILAQLLWLPLKDIALWCVQALIFITLFGFFCSLCMARFSNRK